MSFFKNWQQTIVNFDTTLLEVIKAIDHVGSRFALVTKDGKFFGTITDGDIRRSLIKGKNLDTRAGEIANPKPLYSFNHMSAESLRQLCVDYSVSFIPILDENHVVVNAYVLSELFEAKARENPVVIMAGGLGSRLGDLTRECPKPMLEVNGKPILEHIILECKKHGLNDFYISVNYLSDQIKDYFNDGSMWNVSIKYINEIKRLGTAGALNHMIDIKPTFPILVLNGDILTKVNFTELLNFHSAQMADVTTCVRTFDYRIPYGVVTIERNRIIDLKEKPVQSFQVNAGVYVINNKHLKHVPKDQYFDMTDYLQLLLSQDKKINSFLIHEYWKDIGHKHDLFSAREEFLG